MPTSPLDPTSKVYKCKNNRYKCKNTGKYFNVKTGTIFECTKIRLQTWFYAFYVFDRKKGISSPELSKEIGVTQKSS
jgi:transposase-like protein